MENALTEKLFGMPAWVWGAIVGVGVAGFTYLHKKNSANAASADTSAQQYDANGNPIDTSGTAGTSTTGGDQQYLGTSPLTDYSGAQGGFNYSGPPPAVSADVRLDPKVLAQLNKLAKEEATVKRQQAILNRQRGHRKPPFRSPPPQSGPVRRKTAA
jgi:hypothetical protein